jgi:uncharacterized LabA/DUF88 family protein
VRINVYIDGFNLYHGLKELAATEPAVVSWKWLDVRKLSERIVPRDSVQSVRYFTARVSADGNDPGIQLRQQTYIRALETLQGLTVHYGQFMVQKKRMPLVDTPGPVRRALLRRLGVDVKAHPDGKASVRVWRTEEKGSDVNLATYLLADAFRGAFDKAVVVSNDTDLCEPVRMVVQDLGLPVLVVNPRGHRQPAAALKKVASATRRVRIAAVAGAQMPVTLTDAHGTITKPAGW